MLVKQLVGAIHRFKSASALVLTRLCVALVAIALQTMASGEWNFVGDSVQLFLEQGGTVPYLHVMKILAEEVTSSQKLTAQAREKLSVELNKSTDLVLPIFHTLIRQCLSNDKDQDQTERVKQIMMCLANWIEFLRMGSVISSNIVESVFDCIHHYYDVIAEGVDVIIAVLDPVSISKYPKAVEVIVKRSIDIYPLYTRAVRGWKEVMALVFFLIFLSRGR